MGREARGRLGRNVGGIGGSGAAADRRGIGPKSLTCDRVLGDGHSGPKSTRIREGVRCKRGGGRSDWQATCSDYGDTARRDSGKRLRVAVGSESIAGSGVVEVLLGGRGPRLLPFA